MKLSIRLLALTVFCAALAVGCDKGDKDSLPAADPNGKSVDVKGGGTSGGKPAPKAPPKMPPPPPMKDKDQ